MQHISFPAHVQDHFSASGKRSERNTLIDGLVEGRIGVQMRSEEVLNDGVINREGVLWCHAALSVKTNVFVRTQRWSREALEPHAHVAHLRDADKH